MFSAAEITEMRAAHDEALIDSCAVVRSGSTVATVACAVIQPRRWTQEGAGGFDIGKDVDFTVSLPYGADVRTNDTLTVNGLSLRVGEVKRSAPTLDTALLVETTVEGS